MRWAAGVRGRSSSHQGSHAQYLQSTWAHRNTTEAQSTEKIPHNVQIITLALFSEVKPQCFPNQTDHKTKVRRAWWWCTAEVGLLWISDIYSYDIVVASSSSFTQSVDVCLERVHDILWFSWCPGRNEGKPGQFSLTTSKTTSTKQGQLELSQQLEHTEDVKQLMFTLSCRLQEGASGVRGRNYWTSFTKKKWPSLVVKGTILWTRGLGQKMKQDTAGNWFWTQCA